MTRALEWDGCLNVRDLGGVPLEGGGHTRYGALVRADNIRKLSDDGWRALAGARRRAHRRPALGRGARRGPAARRPRRRGARLAARRARRRLQGRHRRLHGRRRSGRLLGVVLHRASSTSSTRTSAGRWPRSPTRPTAPVVFHCAGGKDRTGLVSALLLRLAGAAIDDIAADYALSEANLNAGPRSWIESAPDETVRRAARVHAADAAGRDGAHARAAGRSAGAACAPYLRAAGLSDAQLERLEARLAAP